MSTASSEMSMACGFQCLTRVLTTGVTAMQKVL